MQGSRDSSLWKSLAVAFGDGLAFGVGMKLSQRAAGTASPAALGPVSDRLAEIEERLRRVERTPLALPAAGSAEQKLDQRVLEAVVQAVESRLNEQAAALERRLADIEARVVVEMRGIHDEVLELARGAEVRIRETGGQFHDELVAVRRDTSAEIAASVERTVDARVAAIAGRMEQIGHAMAVARDAFRSEVGVLQAGFGASAEVKIRDAGAAIRREMAEAMSELQAASERRAASVEEGQAALRRELAEVAARYQAAIEGRVAPVAEEQTAIRREVSELLAASERRAASVEEGQAALRRELAEAAARYQAAIEGRVAPVAEEQAAIRREMSELQAASERRAAAVEEGQAGLRREMAEAADLYRAAVEGRVAHLADGQTKLREEMQVALDDRIAQATDAQEKLRREMAWAAALYQAGLEARVEIIAHEEAGLRSEVAALDRRTAEIEAGLPTSIEQAVEGSVESRMLHAESRLAERLHDASVEAGRRVAREAESGIERRFEPLRADAASARLRAERSEQQVLETLAAIAAVCQSTIGKLSGGPEEPKGPTEPAPPAAEASAPPDPPAEGQPEERLEDSNQPQVPMFDEVRKSGRVWRIPMVSSIVLAAAGWLAAVYW